MANPIMVTDETYAIGDRGLTSFLVAFTITQLVEVPIYLRALRAPHASAAGGSTSEPRSLLSCVLIAFSASLLTHPVVWFVMPHIALIPIALLQSEGRPFGLVTRTLFYGALAETFAVLAEAYWLWFNEVRRPLRWSLIANCASFVVGSLIVKLLF